MINVGEEVVEVDCIANVWLVGCRSIAVVPIDDRRKVFVLEEVGVRVIVEAFVFVYK